MKGCPDNGLGVFGTQNVEIFANAMQREDFFGSKPLNMTDDIKFREFQTRAK